jgi:Carbohydrate esterase, sialic acid-specific acetylesterase
LSSQNLSSQTCSDPPSLQYYFLYYQYKNNIITNASHHPKHSVALKCLLHMSAHQLPNSWTRTTCKGNITMSPITKLTSILLAVAAPNLTSATDLYGFAGQSNMVGWVLGGQSIGGNETFLTNLTNILFNGTGSDLDLYDLIDAYHSRISEYVPSIVQLEVDLLMDLQARGLTSAMTTPLSYAQFFIAQYGSSLGSIRVKLDPPYFYSGISFGPEYMFTRTMQAEFGAGTQENPIQIRKAARGGTQIYADYSPTLPGTRWGELRNAIVKAPPGVYKGFVWFQGENDCLWDVNDPSDDTSPYYLGNLTELVTVIRNLMYVHGGTADHWSSPAHIPVVIVETGYWPRLAYTDQHVREAGQRVVAAQNAFVENDPCAAIVQTVDLCRYYHFDPPSQLIIGDRVAKAMVPLLTQCGPTPPSSSPSTAPSNVGTDAPSQFPSQVESAAPSQFPSQVPSSRPSVAPSNFPSSLPTSNPTDFPSSSPSTGPSSRPSPAPSSFPSGAPTSVCDLCSAISNPITCQVCQPTCEWLQNQRECRDGPDCTNCRVLGIDACRTCSSVCSWKKKNKVCESVARLLQPKEFSETSSTSFHTSDALLKDSSTLMDYEQTVAPTYCNACKELDFDHCDICGCRWNFNSNKCQKMEENVY